MWLQSRRYTRDDLHKSRDDGLNRRAAENTENSDKNSRVIARPCTAMPTPPLAAVVNKVDLTH
jgi:hypothetical protein